VLLILHFAYDQTVGGLIPVTWWPRQVTGGEALWHPRQTLVLPSPPPPEWGCNGPYYPLCM